MLFDLPDVRLDLQQMILRKLNAPTPAISMAHVPQWAGMCKALGSTDNLGDVRVWLAEGAFYNTWTPAPSLPKLEGALEQARANSCAAVLVPTVRQSSSALTDPRLVRIPAYVESSIEFGNDLAGSLRDSISKRRYGDFKRLGLRTEQDCDVRFVRAADASPSFLAEVDRLHSLNASKYGHVINFYDLDALQRLAIGALRTSLYVALVTRRSDDHPLQTMIIVDDPESKSAVFLVQGHETGDELKRLQLYSYAYWSIYQWAAQNGRERVFLSRAKHEDKQRLGANRFWISENWIFSEDNAVLQRARHLAELGNEVIATPAVTALTQEPQ